MCLNDPIVLQSVRLDRLPDRQDRTIPPENPGARGARREEVRVRGLLSG